MNRRELLASVIAAGLLPARAWGEGPVRLGGVLLADPDFAQLRASDPRVVGVRPHRIGGVRLELEEAPLGGRQYLVHDYGHGGAGMTLAWGCASVVVELVEKAMARVEGAPSVAVLGVGVAGLTAATEIRRRWPTVPMTVYAKDVDVRTTTSWIAGGQFEPSGVWREYQDDARRELLASYLRRSRDRILEITKAGQAAAYGIAERDNYTLDHEIKSLDAYTPRDVVAAPKVGPLPFSRLSVPGKQYRTWLVNPTILLPKLKADLTGVAFEQRTFAGKADLAALPANIVVNCTGLGSREVMADKGLVPQRGHLVILKKTAEKQDWFFSGGCENLVVSYVFCRQDDIVVGGTVLSGQDGAAVTAADEPVFAKILGNAGELFAGHPAACKA